MHKAVADAAQTTIASISGDTRLSLSYPPGIELSAEEQHALSDLELNADARSALMKLMTDACSYPVFHLCSLLDGVADPCVRDVEGWVGGKLEPAGDDSLMLHDEFYELFWEYAESK